MKLHWRELETEPVTGEWRGLELTVEGAARARFSIEVCPPCCIRIATGRGPLAWARIFDDYAGYELLLASQRRSLDIIAPISFRTAEENARDDRAAFYRAWARTYATMLAGSEASPLFAGRWYLGPALGRGSARVLRVSALRGVAQRGLLEEIWWGFNRWLDPIALRQLSSPDEGRVRAWRKHARAGSLPPILLYWISGLAAHVILDGHDRALAALLEEVPAPVLFLEPLRDSELDPTREVIFDGVAHAFASAETDGGATTAAGSARRSLSIEEANRLLVSAFSARLVPAPTRAMVLAGGLEAWSREVRGELALQKVEDSLMLAGQIDGRWLPRKHGQ